MAFKMHSTLLKNRLSVNDFFEYENLAFSATILLVVFFLFQFTHRILGNYTYKSAILVKSLHQHSFDTHILHTYQNSTDHVL